MLPTETDASNALEYLAQTDEQLAAELGFVEACKHGVKVARSMAFLEAAGTVAEREAKAETSADVVEKSDELIRAVTDYETTKTKRKRAELVIEVWRSLNANQRRGNV